MTPLHVAAIHGSLPLLRILLLHQGNPLLACRRGTALDLAREHQHSVAVEMIRDSQMVVRKRSTSSMGKMGASVSESRSWTPAQVADHNDLARPSSTATLGLRLDTSSTQSSGSLIKTERSNSINANRSSSMSFTPRRMSSPIPQLDLKRPLGGSREDSQRSLDTYTCKMNGVSGILNVWPRYCAFESTGCHKSIISFIDVVSMKRFVITSGIELLARDVKGCQHTVAFTSLSVPDEEVFNLLNFLIRIRKKPVSDIPLFGANDVTDLRERIPFVSMASLCIKWLGLLSILSRQSSFARTFPLTRIPQTLWYSTLQSQLA